MAGSERRGRSVSVVEVGREMTSIDGGSECPYCGVSEAGKSSEHGTAARLPVVGKKVVKSERELAEDGVLGLLSTSSGGVNDKREGGGACGLETLSCCWLNSPS